MRIVIRFVPFLLQINNLPRTDLLLVLNNYHSFLALPHFYLRLFLILWNLNRWLLIYIASWHNWRFLSMISSWRSCFLIPQSLILTSLAIYQLLDQTLTQRNWLLSSGSEALTKLPSHQMLLHDHLLMTQTLPGIILTATHHILLLVHQHLRRHLLLSLGCRMLLALSAEAALFGLGARSG